MPSSNKLGQVVPNIDDKYFNATSIASKELTKYRYIDIIQRRSYYFAKIPRTTGNCGEATRIQVCYQEMVDNNSSKEDDVMTFILYICGGPNNCSMLKRIAIFSLKSKSIKSEDCAMNNDSYKICCPTLNITNEEFMEKENRFIGIFPTYDRNRTLFKYFNSYDVKIYCKEESFNFRSKETLTIRECGASEVKVLFRVLAGENLFRPPSFMESLHCCESNFEPFMCCILSGITLYIKAK